MSDEMIEHIDLITQVERFSITKITGLLAVRIGKDILKTIEVELPFEPRSLEE